MIKKVQFQYLKVFLFFIILFFSLTSCKNLLITENCKEKQNAYIKISTNQLDNSTRTFLPNGFNENSFLIKWVLTISSEDGDNPLEYTGEDKDDEESTISAYSQMITDTSIELEVGTWTFNLIACNPYTNSTYLESTITKEIKGGENILSFNMKEASGENAAEGNIEFTLYWKNNPYVDSVNYTLYKWDNTRTRNYRIIFY